jgi:hypothetical protein
VVLHQPDLRDPDEVSHAVDEVDQAGSGPVFVGFAAGHTDRAELEHVLARLSQRHGPVVLACTHIVDGHWAGSVQLTGPAPGHDTLADRLATELGVAVAIYPGPPEAVGDPSWRSGAEQAAQRLRARSEGRAILFAGQDRLVGDVPVDDVPGMCAIEEVVGIAGTPTAGATLITREFVRPELQDGRLILEVRPIGPHGAVAPFEVPNPTPCCAAHS